ncbi:MAG: hypothetical protein KGL39_38640 [Patescibacteria group bacterium]|nr:hypothetical protein [Patescibacteria group bacterium]
MAVEMSVAAGAAAGTSPPAPALQSAARDDSALVWVGTGASGTTTGTLLTITFGGNYSSAVDAGAIPRVTASFIGAHAHEAGCYVASVSTRQVVVACAVAPAVGLAATSAGIGVVIRMDP